MQRKIVCLTGAQGEEGELTLACLQSILYLHSPVDQRSPYTYTLLIEHGSQVCSWDTEIRKLHLQRTALKLITGVMPLTFGTIGG